VVERFDRERQGDKLRRLHQEDLLSAMGYDPWLKYERPNPRHTVPTGGFADPNRVSANPGPSLRAMAAFLTQHMGRVQVPTFLRAVTFNVAFGNADSHARNYSVLLPPDGQVRLTPLYDLICTCFYPDLETDFAQRVNTKWDLGQIEVADLVAEAATWDLPMGPARRSIIRLLEQLAAEIGPTIDTCVTRGGDPAAAVAAADLIASRVRRLLS